MIERFPRPQEPSSEEEQHLEEEPMEKMRFWLILENKDLEISFDHAFQYLGPQNASLEFVSLEDATAQIEQNPEDCPEVIILGVLDKPTPFDFDQEGAVKWMIPLRNNPKIKRQPVIIALNDDQQSLNRWVNAGGADVGIKIPMILKNFFQHVESVPDLLNNVETEYAEKMIRSKSGFYAEYEEHVKERSRITADTEQEIGILKDCFEQFGSHKILDAGCGYGRIAKELVEDGYEVTGVDTAEHFIKQAKEQIQSDKAEFYQADLAHLPVANEEHDAVTYNWHVFCDILGNQKKQEVLAEAFRAVKKGGLIILDIPDRQRLEEEKDGVYFHDPGGENIYVGYVPTQEEMDQLLAEAGFEKVEVKRWEVPQEGKESAFPKLSFVYRKPSEG